MPLALCLCLVATVGGEAHCEEVEVRVKGTPSPAAEKLQHAMQAKSPNHPSHYSRLWKIADLKTIDRPAAVKRRRVPLVARSATASARPQPMTFGVPLPKEEIWNAEQMRVVDAGGQELAASIAATATWTPGGSLKWVLVDVQSPVPQAEKPVPLTLEYGADVSAAPVQNPIKVQQSDEQISVDTGPLRVAFSKTRGTLFDQIWLQDRPLLTPDAQHAGLYFTDQSGTTYRADRDDASYELSVEFATPLRVVVKASGKYRTAAGAPACSYVTRVYLYKDQPSVRLFTTWINSEDPARMQWRDIGLRIPFAAAPNSPVALGTDARDPTRYLTRPLDSQPLLIAQTARRKFHVRCANQMIDRGTQLGGWASVPGRDANMTIAVDDMAGHFPNAIEVTPDAVVFHAFSDEAGHALGFRVQDVIDRYGDEAIARFNQHRIRTAEAAHRPPAGPGMARSHELVLHFQPTSSAAPDTSVAALALEPPVALADPVWGCATHAFGYLHPRDPERFPEVEAQLDVQFTAWLDACERFDPHYGWWDHGRGPSYFDGTRTAPDGVEEFLSTGYRRNYGMGGYGQLAARWEMYLRSGDPRWLEAAKSGSRMQRDLMMVHPVEPPTDKRVGTKYLHGGSWTFDAASGPSFADIWLLDLALDFYTTGNQRSMDVLGECVRSMEQCNPLGDPQIPNNQLSIASWVGTAAVYYKATWDPRYRALVEKFTPALLAFGENNPWHNDRPFWVQYALVEAVVDMPQAHPPLVRELKRFAKAHLHAPEQSVDLELLPQALRWYYEQTGDPLVAQVAREQIERAKSARLIRIDSFAEREARYTPVWMTLVVKTAEVEHPRVVTRSVARPHESTLRVRRRQGQPTKLDMSYAGELQLLDDHGQNAGIWLARNAELRLHELRVPAEASSRTLTLVATAPRQLVARLDQPLMLPWHPEGAPLTLRGADPLPIEIAPPPSPTWTFADENRAFPVGRFGQSLRMQGAQGVTLPLGEATDNGAARRHFDARRGTVEFFVRFERTWDQGGYGPRLLDIADGLLRLDADQTLYAKIQSGTNLAPMSNWNAQPLIVPGRWHHLAMQWDLNVEGKVAARCFLDGAPYGHDHRILWPNAFPAPLLDGRIQLGRHAGDEQSAVSIDELRISNIPRYPIGVVSKRTFSPPTAPFTPDRHTLLLHHFDARAPAIGPGAAKVMVEYHGYERSTP